MRRAVLALLGLSALAQAADAPRERSVVFDREAAQALRDQRQFTGTVIVEGVDPDARRFRRRTLEQVFAEGLSAPPPSPWRRMLTPLVATPCHSVAASQVPIGTSFAPLTGCP
jgi:hypothetical protein